jgi:GTPase SAR1 family protein
MLKLISFHKYIYSKERLYLKDCSIDNSRIRSIAYTLCSSIMLCYSIDSIQNVKATISKWKSELKELGIKLPLILVG